MNCKPITLVSFGNFGKGSLRQIAEAIEQEFNCQVITRESRMDLSDYYDPARRQYNGNKLLKAVNSISGQDSMKTIGLFNVDLFIPILTYIFGQAILNGRTGIASLYRLSNERYGLGADEKLLFERFAKVVIHELGHAFGLIHCTTSNCIMRPGTYVEDIDQKSRNFCPNCRKKLENNK